MISRSCASSRSGCRRRPTRSSPPARTAGVNPGFALEHDYPEYPGGLLVAITEQRSRADIDRLVRTVAEVLVELGVPVAGAKAIR